jgi:hypothetical protein
MSKPSKTHKRSLAPYPVSGKKPVRVAARPAPAAAAETGAPPNPKSGQPKK